MLNSFHACKKIMMLLPGGCFPWQSTLQPADSFLYIPDVCISQQNMYIPATIATKNFLSFIKDIIQSTYGKTKHCTIFLNPHQPLKQMARRLLYSSLTICERNFLSE